MTMRNTVKKEIDGRTFTLRELTVAEIRNLLDMAGRLEDAEEEKPAKRTKKSAASELVTMPAMLQEIVGLGCADGLKVAELEKWTPSALAELWAGFREANSAFFDSVERLGVAGLLHDAIKKRLSALSAILSSEATPTPPGTGTVSS